MRNVEIKAFLRNPDSVKAKAEELSSSEPEVIRQTDTFYIVPHGRLKLRVFDDNSGELIFYERSDTKGPKLSSYTKVSFSDKSECDGINDILTKTNGKLGMVKKTRLLYIVGQSRIHIDEVDQLGDFMEIEVVLQDKQDVEVGEKISNNLMKELGIVQDDLISEAYIDLLLKKDTS
ncbi:uncharacterized protein LOC123274911 [Cotesia glomerata]|uniref:CYTH domain-containing protein n=1 Tax=Cotesia glomerata TaxID=32391 RepID=A0AAV7ISM3_COTGL|nr:uncharacterized protein LOC123274911 [Cotesia glomerata]KAH0556519.1 hypothetical protein KQX54_000990 [Cotesia glomerata]